MDNTTDRKRLKRYFQVDVIAAVESQGFKKGENIRGVPLYGGVNPPNTHFFITGKNLMGHLITDALTHEIGIYTECGDPGAFFNTKTKTQGIADHESDNLAFNFSDNTNIVFILNVFVDQGIKINIHGIANNGRANIHHICRVLYIEVSDPYFIQRVSLPLCH
jgi:hypothetical protein